MLNTAQERRAFPRGAGDGVIGELSYLVSLLHSRVLGALRDIQKKRLRKKLLFGRNESVPLCQSYGENTQSMAVHLAFFCEFCQDY